MLRHLRSKVGQIEAAGYMKRWCFKMLAKIPEQAVWKYYHRMVVSANRKNQHGKNFNVSNAKQRMGILPVLV